MAVGFVATVFIVVGIVIARSSPGRLVNAGKLNLFVLDNSCSRLFSSVCETLRRLYGFTTLHDFLLSPPPPTIVGGPSYFVPVLHRHRNSNLPDGREMPHQK